MSTPSVERDNVGIQRQNNRIAILALVVGTIGLGWNVVRYVVSRPPDPNLVLDLIRREAQAAMSGDAAEALELFADDAVIRSISPARVWVGMGQIRKRYEKLPVFKELRHVGATIVFDPSGVFARARSGMTGLYVDGDGALIQIISVRGEDWTFQKTEGAWKIVDFTYGL